MEDPERDEAEPGMDRQGVLLPNYAAARRLIVEVFADEEAPESADAPAVPGYSLGAELGRGGSARVYLARREGWQSPVAMKVYLRPAAGGPGTERAWRELNALSSLRTPAVPRVLDYGLHEGRMYIVTELVEGEPLDRHCRRRNLARRTRVELLARTADAVQQLHEHGVIHRDLKPSNILVDKRGSPMVVDLGIAHVVADDPMETITAEGVPIGTPAFMSPEQAAGRPEEISTRSDIYSLGAIAYLILTGATPHDMDTTIHEAVRRVVQCEPREPRTLDPRLPRPLAAVLRKAVARSPARRYASAAGFGADLRRWARGEPVQAASPGLWAGVTRWIGRHPRTATTAASLLIAAAIFGWMATVSWWRMQRPHRVQLTGGGRYVQLLSVSGNVLRTWDAGEGCVIRFAEVVDRAPRFGGGRVLIMDLPNQPGVHRAGSRLTFWDVSDLRRPYWQSPEHLEAPGGLNGRANQFGLGFGTIVADVFPESPGLEVVQPFVHVPDEPSAHCVFDLGGKLLYRVWHWGSSGPDVWLSRSRVLVIAGCNNEYRWSQLGFPQTRIPWPRVIFAIRPEYGRMDGWINGPVEGPRAQPLWYRWLLPGELADRLRFELGPSSVPGHAHDAFDLSIDILGSEAGIRRTYRADGSILETVPNDFYEADPSIPPADVIGLGPMPEPVEDHAPEADPS